MLHADTTTEFEARLRRPAASPDAKGHWAFVLIPKYASDKLPRRGRTTVEGTFEGCPFVATLEPDGRLSHWLRVDEALLAAASAKPGDEVVIRIAAVEQEPEPALPADLQRALLAAPEAQAGWKRITTIARVDWIHWITAAKQVKTRTQRIDKACDMLASGKRRVCCFDPSGYYSKAFGPPEEAG